MRPDMSDLRFEAIAQKKQVITCKGKREKKNAWKKRGEIVKKARMRENKTGDELM